MPVLKIDALDLSDTTNYEVKLNGYQLGQPPNKMEFQDYLQDDGGQIIEGSNRYGIVPHVFAIEVKGATRAAFHTNVSALAQKVAKCRRSELTLEFRYDGSTNSNYADVLAITTDVPLDPVWIRAHKDIVIVTFHCKPFWRGAQQTIGPLAYTPSPAVIKPGTILGDVDTDAYIEFRGKGTTTFGNNLILSARSKNQIDETLYNPIKNFQGTAEATSTYGGQFTRKAGVNNSGFTSLTGETRNVKSIAMVSATRGYAACDGGYILKTTNNWGTAAEIAPATTGTSNDLKDIQAFYDAGGNDTLFACGAGGIIIKSTNGGTGFSALTSGTTKTLYAIHLASATAGLVVGAAGTILYTADGSAWSPKTAWRAPDLTTFIEVDPNNRYSKTSSQVTVTGLTMTEDAYIYKDFGDSFFGDFEHRIDVRADSGSGAEFVPWGLANGVNDESGLAPALAVKMYPSGLIYANHRTSSGDTHFASYAGAASTTYYLTISRAGAVFAVKVYSDSGRTSLLATLQPSADATPYRYLYAANSWNNNGLGTFTGLTQNLKLKEVADLKAVYSLSSSEAWVGGASGALHRTADSAATWTDKCLSELTTTINGLAFTASATGWLADSTGKVKKTTDTGGSWATQLTASAALTNIGMQSATNGWAIGATGLIYKTGDGTAWGQQTSSVGVTLNDLSIVDADTVFVCGDGYTILETEDASTWTQPIVAWALSSATAYEGTARVYARVRTADATPALVQVRASSGWAGGTVIDSDAVYLANSTQWQWVDLGPISIPCSPLSPEIAATPIIQLGAKGSSGTGYNFDTEVACLVYEDGEILFVKSGATASDYITADRENEAVNKGRTNVTFVGGAGIKLRPGTLNNILALETQVWAATTDGIDDFDVVLKYTPKYLSPVA